MGKDEERKSKKHKKEKDKDRDRDDERERKRSRKEKAPEHERDRVEKRRTSPSTAEPVSSNGPDSLLPPPPTQNRPVLEESGGEVSMSIEETNR
jgi:hypothetical protein